MVLFNVLVSLTFNFVNTEVIHLHLIPLLDLIYLIYLIKMPNMWD